MVVASLVLAPLAACGSFGSGSEPGPTLDAGLEGTDAPTPLDAATPPDAGPDAVSSTDLLDDGFESGVNCKGWTLQNARVSLVAGRSGLACRVCSMLGVDQFFGLFRPLTPTAGTSYSAEAWIRDVSQATPVYPFVQLESATADGGTNVYPASGQAPATWSPFNTPVALEPNRLFIGAQTKALGDCFLVDDVSVQKQ